MNTTQKAPDWDRLVVETAIGEGINSGNRGLVEARREQGVAKRYARWQRDRLRDPASVNRAKQALRENGLNEEGGSPHSWRCEDKSRYPGPCRCVDEIVQDVIAALMGDQ